MANDLKILQGFDGIVMVRDLAKAKTEDAKMVPYLTSTDFELSRDSDSTATKSGNVAKVGGLETSFSFETLDSTSETLDLLHKSLVDKTTLEFWFVKLGMLGTDGQKYLRIICVVAFPKTVNRAIRMTTGQESLKWQLMANQKTVTRRFLTVCVSRLTTSSGLAQK